MCVYSFRYNIEAFYRYKNRPNPFCSRLVLHVYYHKICSVYEHINCHFKEKEFKNIKNLNNLKG